MQGRMWGGACAHAWGACTGAVCARGRGGAHSEGYSDQRFLFIENMECTVYGKFPYHSDFFFIYEIYMLAISPGCRIS